MADKGEEVEVITGLAGDVVSTIFIKRLKEIGYHPPHDEGIIIISGDIRKDEKGNTYKSRILTPGGAGLQKFNPDGTVDMKCYNIIYTEDMGKIKILNPGEYVRHQRSILINHDNWSFDILRGRYEGPDREILLPDSEKKLEDRIKGFAEMLLHEDVFKEIKKQNYSTIFVQPNNWNQWGVFPVNYYNIMEIYDSNIETGLTREEAIEGGRTDLIMAIESSKE
jgi:hypothetical protein